MSTIRIKTPKAPSPDAWDRWFQALPSRLVPAARSEIAKGMGFTGATLAPVEEGGGVNGLRLTDSVNEWLASVDWTPQQLEETVRGRATASPFPGDHNPPVKSIRALPPQFSSRHPLHSVRKTCVGVSGSHTSALVIPLL